MSFSYAPPYIPFSYISDSFTCDVTVTYREQSRSNVNLLITSVTTVCGKRRSQWPRGLKRRFAAVRLLGSWVRIPPGHRRLSVVSVVCYQLEVSVTSWPIVQGSPTDCGASLCVTSKPHE